MQPTYRPIRLEDNATIASVTRAVLLEFGVAGPGTAFEDPELDRMFETYQPPRHAYFVAEHQGAVIGGCGIAPLRGAETETCELQKFYLVPNARGKGAGKALIDRCLETARQKGFKQCYIETVMEMTAARKLYERCGFRYLDKSYGNTGHHRCTVWMLRDL